MLSGLNVWIPSYTHTPWQSHTRASSLPGIINVTGERHWNKIEIKTNTNSLVLSHSIEEPLHLIPALSSCFQPFLLLNKGVPTQSPCLHRSGAITFSRGKKGSLITWQFVLLTPFLLHHFTGRVSPVPDRVSLSISCTVCQHVNPVERHDCCWSRVRVQRETQVETH